MLEFDDGSLHRNDRLFLSASKLSVSSLTWTRHTNITRKMDNNLPVSKQHHIIMLFVYLIQCISSCGDKQIQVMIHSFIQATSIFHDSCYFPCNISKIQVIHVYLFKSGSKLNILSCFQSNHPIFSLIIYLVPYSYQILITNWYNISKKLNFFSSD